MNDVVGCCSDGTVQHLPMCCIPIQWELVHDICAQEEGKFLDGALDKHLKAGVEVGEVGFQSSDVPTDTIYLLHEKFLCKIGRAHRGAQELKASSELDVSGGAAGSISFTNGVGGNSGMDL